MLFEGQAGAKIGLRQTSTSGSIPVVDSSGQVLVEPTPFKKIVKGK
jgi:hypothetical protein